MGEPFVQDMLAEYDRRRKLMTRRFNEIGLHCFEPKGAFYCFPDVTTATGLSAEDFAQALLTEEQVAVVPGEAFGPSGAGHVRACYATAYEQIVEAMDRIERFVERHRASLGSGRYSNGLLQRLDGHRVHEFGAVLQHVVEVRIRAR